jgi:nucleoid-associated protein YgaU
MQAYTPPTQADIPPMQAYTPPPQTYTPADTGYASPPESLIYGKAPGQNNTASSGVTFTPVPDKTEWVVLDDHHNPPPKMQEGASGRPYLPPKIQAPANERPRQTKYTRPYVAQNRPATQFTKDGYIIIQQFINLDNKLIHRVARGDSLYSIAREYWGGDNASFFPLIIFANPTITDPDEIHIGDVIVIPDLYANRNSIRLRKEIIENFYRLASYYSKQDNKKAAKMVMQAAQEW